MVIVSCAAKFHAFALAEQLKKHNKLTGFYTAYAYQKNTLFRRFTKRVDKESIPAHLIHTNIPLAFLIKGMPHVKWLDLYDKWVASQLKKRKDYDVFIGWSGMSLHAIRQAKKDGKIAIITRGSSHILYQDKILREEYKKFGIDFHVNQQVIEKELKEYEDASYIVVPSSFAKNSFLNYGFSEEKIFCNNTGVSTHFSRIENKDSFYDSKFRIVYLGSLTIRKGLIYLFEALNQLNISKNQFEVWFIGNIADEMKVTIDKLRQDNWKFFGHINHYELSKLLSECDLGVQPSNEEGLSMVINQMLSCGIPVIATTNTGGADIIDDGINGFIIPIRSPHHIKEKIEYIYHNPEILAAMKASAQTNKESSWDDYGKRYLEFLSSIIRQS